MIYGILDVFMLLLRDRGHPYNLTEYNTSIHNKLFIVRTLYMFIYIVECITCST